MVFIIHGLKNIQVCFKLKKLWNICKFSFSWKIEFNSTLISAPILAKPFESLIGPFGVVITRINYVIYLNGILAIKGIDRSPKLSNIQVKKVF